MSMINDIMDDEKQNEQVIMVNGKPKKVKAVLDELLNRRDCKKREYSEG